MLSDSGAVSELDSAANHDDDGETTRMMRRMHTERHNDSSLDGIAKEEEKENFSEFQNNSLLSDSSELEFSYFPVPNFAKYFSLDDFRDDERNTEKIESFIHSVAFWEGRFANTNGVGLNSATGLTYDGRINF